MPRVVDAEKRLVVAICHLGGWGYWGIEQSTGTYNDLEKPILAPQWQHRQPDQLKREAAITLGHLLVLL